MSNPIPLLMKQIGYYFKNTGLIEEALRHSSFVNEQVDKSLSDNERLEFLGDAVLNLAIGHLLMVHYPNTDEGNLSKMRANLVNEVKLGEIARELDLGNYMQFGKGEIQSNGREKQSILADAFEALVAALYLDGGYDTAFAMVRTLFADHLDHFDEPDLITDYKSALQELAQINRIEMPTYEIIREFGPDHDKTFVVRLSSNPVVTEGIGKNKKSAEQNAAARAYKIISQTHQK